MDQELYKLCKEVYEKTRWFGTEEHIRTEFPTLRTVHSNGKPYEIEGKLTNIPLYTSDYLLEKLPTHTRLWKYGLQQPHYEAKNLDTGTASKSDTPLKALLKLTIALHDAGAKL